MVKVLNGEFRKNLYKDLVDAGYEKEEAQVIVGKKYYSALKDHVLGTLSSLADNVRNGKYAVGDTLTELPDQFAELYKMQGFLEPYMAKAKTKTDE